MHRAIRNDLDRMTRVSRELDAGNVDARARFSRWVEFLWMMVEHHHHNEDSTMFPAIRRLDADFDPSTFEAEHQELQERFAIVGERIGALDTTADVGAAQVALTDAVAALRDFMQGHLDREEGACVERMDRLFEPGVVKAIERQSARTTPMKIMTKMVPWMMSAASAEDCIAIRERLPFLFRWLNELFWAPSFKRAAAWQG